MKMESDGRSEKASAPAKRMDDEQKYMCSYEETFLEGLFSSRMGSNHLNDSGNRTTGSVELFATGDIIC